MLAGSPWRCRLRRGGTTFTSGTRPVSFSTSGLIASSMGLPASVFSSHPLQVLRRDADILVPLRLVPAPVRSNGTVVLTSNVFRNSFILSVRSGLVLLAKCKKRMIWQKRSRRIALCTISLRTSLAASQYWRFPSRILYPPTIRIPRKTLSSSFDTHETQNIVSKQHLKDRNRSHVTEWRIISGRKSDRRTKVAIKLWPLHLWRIYIYGLLRYGCWYVTALMTQCTT